MKIQVLHNYGGSRTKEQRIYPGTYEHDDERLFGLAGYLVANGHAIGEIPLDELVEHGTYTTFGGSTITVEIENDASKPIPADILRTPDYNDLTMDELRTLLEAYDKTEIDVVSDMNADWRTRKAEIIAWLESR